MVVSVDWFSLSCEMKSPWDGRALYLPPLWSYRDGGCTAVWQHRLLVFNPDGLKVATLLCCPRSHVIPAGSVLVEIANLWLYYDTFLDTVDVILSCLPLTVRGVNRVDLACDFEMDDSKWQILRELENGTAYVKALRRGVVWWTSNIDARSPHQLSWGGKESAFKWKLYNKYKELHELGENVCSKPYIEELWRACGMVVSRVWRLEVSITDANRLVLSDGRTVVAPLDWWVSRADIFASIYADKFVVKMRGRGKDRRSDPIVSFLDIKADKMLWHSHGNAVERTSDQRRRVVWKLWQEWRDLEVQGDKWLCMTLRNALCDMMEDAGLMYYVSMRSGVPVDEIVECLCQGDKTALPVRATDSEVERTRSVMNEEARRLWRE